MTVPIGRFSDSSEVRKGRKPKDFDVEEARRLRGAGFGWRAIAAVVGVSYQTVRRRLK